MGVIKGSEETLNCSEGFLDRSTYIDLSRRSHATFADQRDRIYDLFEAYLKLKRSNRDRDAADRLVYKQFSLHVELSAVFFRSHRIIRHSREHGILGQKIDYLFVQPS
jgi:hypothetical protein